MGHVGGPTADNGIGLRQPENAIAQRPCATADASSVKTIASTPTVLSTTEQEAVVVRELVPDRGSRAEESETQKQRKVLRISLDFRADHRRFLEFATFLILIVLMIEWVSIALQRPEPVSIERGEHFQRQFQVEINSATWVEWLQLEGIGPSMAHRIVADRKLNGPFRSIDDISRVPGIGPATLDRIRRWLTIRHDLTDTTSSESHIPESIIPESSIPR